MPRPKVPFLAPPLVALPAKPEEPVDLPKRKSSAAKQSEAVALANRQRREQIHGEIYGAYFDEGKVKIDPDGTLWLALPQDLYWTLTVGLTRLRSLPGLSRKAEIQLDELTARLRALAIGTEHTDSVYAAELGSQAQANALFLAEPTPVLEALVKAIAPAPPKAPPPLDPGAW